MLAPSSPTDVSQSSGTAVARNGAIPFQQSSPRSSNDDLERGPGSPTEGQGQALESHEVIELQMFSERKAWIEQKIKFLEKMPPIEVFVGLDAVRRSAEEVPGLPTRAELQQWIVEHDTIEKETEIFDTGEFKKLRQLTKAATQRNLSPADTDVIELTLTTIYELDKLLHLLRDRSENLELLGVRLTWEEYRISAWVDRRNIIEDLRAFLDTRARWTPSVYESIIPPEETPDLKRRGSITSLASVSSESSNTSSGFSRSARFKLAEFLSRDAAQFAGRVTSLRHGKITAAGKVLDKLIDHSRKPVPEELLDEQDRLEEKGIIELEQIGKFIMSLVMQWRKADEIYVETTKDKFSAQNLLEEIETAKLYHPTARQSASFISRADALVKRLALRSDPTSSSSTFPCPEHHLFSDQKGLNETLAQTLSLEISATTELARRVDAIAKAYRSAYEAVHRVETLTKTAEDLSKAFITIIERLQDGVSAGDGDGSPPNLMSEACLEPVHHSAFLALLPSIIKECIQTTESADLLLRSSHSAFHGLDLPGIDPAFRAHALSEVQQLTATRNRAQDVCSDVKARVDRLRDARSIWVVMGENLKDLEDVRRRIGEAMEKQRWRQDINVVETPLTPDSRAPTPLPAELSSSEVEKELDLLNAALIRDIDAPLTLLSENLEAPLNSWLSQSAMGLKGLLETVVKMAHLLQSIQGQAIAMRSLHDEFNDLQIRIEDFKMRIGMCMEEVLAGGPVSGDIVAAGIDLRDGIRVIQDGVKVFIDGLTERVPFIARHSDSSRFGVNFVKRRFSSVDLKLGASWQQMTIELPFELTSLDDAVRSDSNSFAMRISGKLESLTQTAAHLSLARMAKDLDSMLSATVADINKFSQELSQFRTSFSAVMLQGDIFGSLDSLENDVEKAMSNYRSNIGRSFSPIRELLRDMDRAPGAHDAAVHEHLYVARSRAVSDAQLRYQTCNEDLAGFKEEVLHARRTEAQRLELIRIAEERRQQEERGRAAAEKSEKARVDQERRETEERRRLEEEQRVEELRQQAEKEEIAAKEADRARLERERFQAEENRRLEDERIAEEIRVKVERDRADVERARLYRVRLEMEEKLRAAEEQLAEERRQQAEKERIITEISERQRIEVEEREELLVEEEHQAEQRRLGVESRDEVVGKPKRKRVEQERRERNLVASEHRRPQQKVMLPADRTSTDAPKKALRVYDDDDVFGFRVAPSEAHSKTREMSNLQAQILALRKRLRSISINEISRPSKLSSRLPDQDRLKKMTREFSNVSSDVAQLPMSAEDSSVETELRSLRAEIEASAELMKRVAKLADLSDAIRMCDAALSDLLEHIDSYPASPESAMSSSHRISPGAPPDEQLSARLTFTRDTIGIMSSAFAGIANDSRAIAERRRIVQAWSELEEMGNDRLSGKKSRPDSAISSRHSSGRNSSTSIMSTRPAKKASGYHNLSVASRPSRGRLLVPSYPTPRRAVSGSVEQQSRPGSQLSHMSSNRSTSGPLNLSLYGSTFASRQRTTSLSNSTPTPVRHPSGAPLRSRAQTGQSKRSGSPTHSEASSYSQSVRGPSRSSTSLSTWSRAPRNSLSSIIPRVSTPHKKVPPRKTYVPDPKNKLDVAVGDVVNKLPVGINIEGVSETWKDQSGKYWIGNQDPKLCFCRILRSQTVMVRVGGGWTELSKFIKDHFADSFRLIPESPPRQGALEEKWISSATLLEAPEWGTPPMPPRTPEPSLPFVPSFSLSTPNRQSPHSIKSISPSAKGSPLTPLQFIRRADVELLRPVTPSKPPTLRSRNAVATHTPARNSVWRP